MTIMNFRMFVVLCLTLNFTGIVVGMGKKMPHGQPRAIMFTWVLTTDINAWLEESPDILGDAMCLLEADLTEPVEALLSKWSSDPLRQDDVRYLEASLELFEGHYAVCFGILSGGQHLPEAGRRLRKYVAPLVELAKNFNSFESSHFIFYSQRNDAFLHHYALPALEQAYARIKPEFNFSEGNAQEGRFKKVRVEVYPDMESFSIASSLSIDVLKRSGAVGAYKFGRVMIVSPRALPNGYRWLDALCHEYVHKLVNQMSGYNCPLWLHEGVAHYFDTRWRSADTAFPLTPNAETELAQAWSSGKLVPFSRMEPSLVDLESHEQLSLAFAQVLDAVSFMRMRYGQEKVAELIRGFRHGKRESVFESALGVSQKKFEEMWEESLATRHFVQVKGAMPDITSYDPREEIDEFVDVGLRGSIRLGDKLLKQGEALAALAQYDKVWRKIPDNPVVLTRMAKSYVFLRDFSTAEERLKHSIAMNPNYESAYSILGELYYEQGAYKNALNALDEAMAINPFNPWIHKLMGKTYAHLDSMELALRETNIVLELLPNDDGTRAYLRALEASPLSE